MSKQDQQELVKRLHDLFNLDPESGVLTRKLRTSNSVRIGDVADCLCGSGYMTVNVGGRNVYSHRVVFAMTHGYFPPQVDHINGIKTDNRPSNLRAATNAQNNQNRAVQSNNTSGVKGVSWDARKRKWRVQCSVSGRRKDIGYFGTLAEADAAARATREAAHKEFARHE